MARTTRDLEALSKIADEYGAGYAERKLALLDRLAELPLPSARAVYRLHELLLLLRAYPRRRGRARAGPMQCSSDLQSART